MKKIRLNLDHIEVESFPTANVSKDTGTVEANFRSRPGDTFCADCSMVDSCDPCNGTEMCGWTLPC
jgi:hypothetical protein